MMEIDTRRDSIESAFAHPAFVASRRTGAAALLLGGAPLRLIWANVAAAGVFEAADARELAARLLRSDRGSARRLEHLAASLGRGEPPRLERLRFSWAFSPRSLTFLCARPALDDGVPLLALTTPSAGSDADLWLTEAPGLPNGDRHDGAGAAAPLPIDPFEVGDALAQTRGALKRAVDGTGQLRFVWRTDAEGQVIDLDHALLQRLGLGWPVPGRALAASAAQVDLTGAELLAQAMARQITWSGIEIAAPVEPPGQASGLAFRLPLVLSGSPAFESGGRFAGYRGFGRIDLVRLVHRPAEAPLVGSPGAESDLRGSDAVLRDGEHRPVDLDDRSVEAAGVAPRPTAPMPDSVTPQRSATVVHFRPPARGSAARSGEALAEEGDPGGDRSLSESERINFQEIGRTLSAAVGAVAADGASPSLGHPHQAAEGADALAQAALLVESTAACLMVTRHPRVLFTNQALLMALRYDSHAALADALGLHFAIHPAPGAGGSAALVLPDADGEAMRFDAVGRPIQWEGVAAMLWTLQRATARPVASRAASDEDRSAADPSLLLDTLDLAVAAIDPHGRIVSMNRSAAAWFAAGSAEPLLTTMLAPESQAGILARLNEFRSDPGAGRRTSADHVARMADGTVIPIGLSITRLAPDRLAVTWRDLSAEREAEWELSRLKSQSERASEQQPGFMAKISHEIRTPLNAILGFAEIMIDERFGPLGNARYKDYLRDIHASGEQVMKLLGDLLDLSRIEAGKIDLDLGPVDVNKIVSDCVAQGQAEAHRRRVIVRTSLASRLPMASADERTVRQMVSNILANAVKFNEPGGQVIVSSTVNETGAAVIVRLRDTGIGMTDAEIATALEPFRQLAPARSQGSTGLGLPLTKALALANGASLSIRSKPGQGTLVELIFQSCGTSAVRLPA